MKNTKQEVIKAIKYFADQYDLKGYDLIIKETPLPELIKMIAYDMFIYGFNIYDCSIPSYRAYTILRIYAIELNKNGFVNFEEK